MKNLRKIKRKLNCSTSSPRERKHKKVRNRTTFRQFVISFPGDPGGWFGHWQCDPFRGISSLVPKVLLPQPRVRVQPGPCSSAALLTGAQVQLTELQREKKRRIFHLPSSISQKVLRSKA